MRFTLSLLATALLAMTAQAAVPLRPILVAYPSDTQDSIVKAAQDAITKAGGEITHVYEIFKGFAAKAPQAVLTTAALKAGGAEIEDDSEFTTQPIDGVSK